MPRGLTYLLFTLFLMLNGCAYDRCYDVSSQPPFSAYTGRDIALTQKAFLVVFRASRCDGQPGPAPFTNRWTRLYLSTQGDQRYREAESALSLPEAAEYVKIIELPVGTKIRIHSTLFRAQNNGFLSGFMHYETLVTFVEIHPIIPGWPEKVEAWFNYELPHTEKSFLKMRVAPWEPAGTPADRVLKWPKEKLRVKPTIDFY